MRGLVRPLRFLAVSVPLFALWEYLLRDPYLFGLAHLFAGTANLFRLGVEVTKVSQGEIHLAYREVAWADEFGMTGINVVAFVSLVLATGGATWRRRLRMLGIGLPALVLTQVLGLWSDIVHVHLHGNPGTAALATGLREFMTGFGTFLFPLAIWLVLVRDRLPLRGPAR